MVVNSRDVLLLYFAIACGAIIMSAKNNYLCQKWLMFSGLSVCLFCPRDFSKSYERILMKFFGKIEVAQRPGDWILVAICIMIWIWPRSGSENKTSRWWFVLSSPFSCIIKGATENAGPSKMQGWKTRDHFTGGGKRETNCYGMPKV